ncbi:unnamed protein product [Trichobilharzia regenti]|nr:unnamed protein product [Trichobilharzia regenti]
MSTKQSLNTFVQQQHQHHQQQQPPHHHHHQQQQQQQYSPPVSNTQRHFEFTSGAVYDSSSLHLPKSLSSSSPSNRYPSTAQSSHAYADDDNNNVNDNDNLRKLNSTSYSPQHHSTLPSSYNNTNYQPASGNNTFFTPIPHTDSQTDISSTGNTQQGFDYFANIQSIQSRSRTVSGTSEHSTGGATNTSTPFNDKVSF